MENIKKEWEIIQNKVIENIEITDELPNFDYFSGFDISFSKEYKNLCVSTLCILERKTLELIYMDSIIEVVEVPYISSYLAFREHDSVVKLIENFNNYKLGKPFIKFNEKYDFLENLINSIEMNYFSNKIDKEKINLGVCFFDGNGYFHPRKSGLATYSGILNNLISIGCAKSFFTMDGLEINYYKEIKKDFQLNYKNKKGIIKNLIGKSGITWGAAVKNTKKSFEPLIVSIGNKINLKNAIELSLEVSKFKVVEPVRLADKNSRTILEIITPKIELLTNSQKSILK